MICEKKKYKSKHHADNDRKTIEKKKGESDILHIYFCEECKYYHLGRDYELNKKKFNKYGKKKKYKRRGNERK